MCNKRLLCVLSLISLYQVLFAAKNIIVMIGDGMGLSVIGVTKYYHEFVELNKKPMNIESVAENSQIAVLYTHSKSHLIPDSAAAATAFGCGIKTANGKVGVDQNDQPVENIVELATRVGKSIGLVTTCEIVDATPAGFSAHATHRSEGKRIAKEQLSKKINVLLGGGKSQYDLKQAEQLGYKVITSREELKKIDTKKTNLLLGVFAASAMSYYKSRKPTEPTLTEMIEIALKILSNDPDGFFLVIEGGRIDHACHDNNLGNMLQEMYEFDTAIGVVKNFIDTNRDTLLLITADHDTGGIAITKDEFQITDYPKVEDLKEGRGIFWISKHHTAAPTILIGTGPGSEKIKGFKDNTFIFRLLKDSL